MHPCFVEEDEFALPPVGLLMDLAPQAVAKTLDTFAAP